jgi:hypothetical protein
MAYFINATDATDAFIRTIQALKESGKEVIIGADTKTIELTDVVIRIERPWNRINHVKDRKWSHKYGAAEFCWYMTANPNVDVIADYLPN